MTKRDPTSRDPHAHLVVRYSTDVLREACGFVSREDPVIAQKPQLNFIADYLHVQGCQTMLIEEDYTERDYLDDYATYFAKCHQGYRRKCRRLHFFRCTFTQVEYDGFLEGTLPDFASRLRAGEGTEAQAYLGFLVLKPLPRTFVGRTCLLPYPRLPKPGGGAPSTETRHYPSVHEEIAHLGGMALSVLTLPYQEQDSVVSACATTALWCSLSQTGSLFRHTKPTPAQITRVATEHGQIQGRVLPNRGLELGQMCRAILTMGLEVESRKGSLVEDVRGLIYGYLAFGLPVVLGLEESGSNPPRRHAVTVCGYSLDGDSRVLPTLADYALPLTSDRITALYVHDDQNGPFTRLDLLGVNRLKRRYGARRPDYDLFAVVVPLYHKIRVRYETAVTAAAYVAAVIGSAPDTGSLVWNVRLELGTNVAAFAGSSTGLAPDVRARLLQAPWPRFVWLASAEAGGRKILDVVIDATDLETAFIVNRLIFWDTSVATRMKSLLANAQDVKDIRQYAHYGSRILECIEADLAPAIRPTEMRGGIV